ncbi:esterase [Streptomyces spiroverticillatus]|uniref:prolyl aminopeptidase n=1 Tax=Streptomyces finlayi TaxID=67296 RepID=A0A918WXQ1_9ACTN|nr:alpha/beta hydrolase [Streptomyces finlayi]GGZ92117.1 esterase [Streptomyces spiroverticillatus]GHC93285.1 esterase [Streptomyces finlayi]
MPALTRVCTTTAAAVFALVSCVGSAPPQSAPPGKPVLTNSHPCPGAEKATCSELVVPLDRTRRKGVLKLQVAAADNADAPRGVLLFLTGGPGQPGVEYLKKVREGLPRAVADYRLVMIDQRGTGGTALDCPQLQKEVGGSDTVPPTRAAVRACAERLGESRNHFTTADAVADLDDLRRALGVRRWSLDGVSYGTFTAGQYALTHPGNVTRLVLDSVVPLDAADGLYTASLRHAAQVLRTACREQSCGYDPAADLAKVVRRDGNGVGVFNLLVTASIIDAPLKNPRYGILGALHKSAAGDTGQLDALVKGFAESDGSSPKEFSSGLHAATLCADTPFPWGNAASPEARRAAALDRAVRKLRERDVWPFEARTAAGQGIAQTCLHWPVSRALDAADGYRALKAPVLLLQGDRDISTPLPWAREVTSRLPQAELVVLKGAGHSTQLRVHEGAESGARAAESFLLR